MLYLFKPQALLCCKILILIDRAGADDKVARRAPELFFVLDCQDLLILVDGVGTGGMLGEHVESATLEGYGLHLGLVHLDEVVVVNIASHNLLGEEATFQETFGFESCLVRN